MFLQHMSIRGIRWQVRVGVRLFGDMEIIVFPEKTFHEAEVTITVS